MDFAGGAVQPVPAKPAINPWIIAITVTLATFMELLDTSIANVALPHIAGGLATDQDQSTWVLTSYLVANAVVLPLSAWLSRVFGRKNYYMTCVALFTISSFLCGLAPNLGMLIFFRVLQGAAGGGLAPCEQAILVDTFPAAKRAGAFALYSMAIVMAPAIGPTLGGWITDNYSWRWIFFINIPVGALSLVLTHILVSDPPEFKKEVEETRRLGWAKVDYLGILLIAIGFGCLEVVLDKGQEDDWFGSRFIIFFTVVAVSALVIAIIWGFLIDDPVVDLSLLKDRNFALSSLFYFFFGFILYGSTVLIPQLLQALEGYTAQLAGEVLTPGALVIVVLAPIVVRLIKYSGAKPLIFFGFFVFGISLFRFSQLDLTASFGTFAQARILQGFGIAFLFVPISQVAYSYLPPEKNNKASSLTNLFRNEGGSFGIAFVTTFLARRSQFHQTVLSDHVTTYDVLYRDKLTALTDQFMRMGMTTVDAAHKAQGEIYRQVREQASLLSYLDCFWTMAIIAICVALIALLIKPFSVSGDTPSAH